MTKYEPLRKFLANQTARHLTLQMQEIEQIIADTLPASAYRYTAWWSNSTTTAHPHSQAWTECGYCTVHVKDTIRERYIIFEKQ